MAQPDYIWRIILNTGRAHQMTRDEVSAEAEAYARSVIATDGVKSINDGELLLVVSRWRSHLYMTVKSSDAAVNYAVIGVARRSAGAAELWAELHQEPIDDGYATNPADVPRAPWVGIALGAQLRNYPRERMLGIVGIAKMAAWAWIEGNKS